jgi:hypothetical protein
MWRGWRQGHRGSSAALVGSIIVGARACTRPLPPPPAHTHTHTHTLLRAASIPHLCVQYLLPRLTRRIFDPPPPPSPHTPLSLHTPSSARHNMPQAAPPPPRHLLQPFRCTTRSRRGGDRRGARRSGVPATARTANSTVTHRPIARRSCVRIVNSPATPSASAR